MGSLDWDLPANSVKHTPVPDCVAVLNSLWERGSVKTVLPLWTSEVALVKVMIFTLLL